MTPQPVSRHRLLALGAGLVLLAGQAWGADAQQLRTRALAATCAHCHGTDGRAVEGEALVRLAGAEGQQLGQQGVLGLAGQRPATIMHQITRGYSPEQLDDVAGYFAAQK
jgi:cytochrome subunit of sulfide dehydrogenase